MSYSALYLSAGDYPNAATMLQNLPLQTSNDTLYAWIAGLALNLYGNNKTWYDLDTASADSLTKIVQYDRSSGYLAGSIASLIGLAPGAYFLALYGPGGCHMLPFIKR